MFMIQCFKSITQGATSLATQGSYSTWGYLIIIKENSNDWVSVNLLVHHKSKDTHHSSTSVVQFDGTLAELGLGAEVIPAKVNCSIAEVTGEFGSSSNILHSKELKKTNEKDDLSKTGLGDGVRARDGGKTIGVVREGVTLKINASWQVESCAGDNLSKEGKHADASVLELNIAKAVELGFVTVSNKSERIIESKRLLGTKLSLEGAEGRSSGCLLGRSKSSSGCDEGGEDSELHFA
jgi:hypothetical protein